MTKLHNSPGCTKYIHELLDVIQTSMIVVLSLEAQRIRSGSLLMKLEAMHQKIGDPAYSLQPCPENRAFSPPIGAEAKLNEHAMKRINGVRGPLDIYKRRTAIPMTVKEMEQIDNEDEDNLETWSRDES
jgi:hypothetical protein